MAHGLKIRNNNVLVVDDNYKNLGLRQKVTLTQGSANPRGEYRLVFNIGCSRGGVLAYRSLSNFTGVVWYTQTSEDVKAVTMSSYAPITIEVYVFDDPINSARTGPIGLRVKNQTTGEWTFDSRCKYMKILGFATAVQSVVNNPYTTFAGGSRVPAAIPVQNYRYDWEGSFDTGSGSVFEYGGDNLQMLCSGNNIQIKLDEWTYDNGGSGGVGTNTTSGTGLVMFVDVTGF
jgi:hypothetical protein